MKRHFQYTRRHKGIVAFAGFAGCVFVLAISLHTAVSRPSSFSSFRPSQPPTPSFRSLPPQAHTPSDTARLRQLDSLILARPGFIDSIRMALHYYSLLKN
ncbi:MAG: hypothetical protein JST68_00485 [Bacteroidetes bacterium]|nr:hypothetical protein [Bacteroidota bacterium]